MSRNETNVRNLALALIKARKAAGFTRQSDLAEASGVSRATVAKIEQFDPSVSLKSLHAIEAALGLPVGALLAIRLGDESELPEDGTLPPLSREELELMLARLGADRFADWAIGEILRRQVTHSGDTRG